MNRSYVYRFSFLVIITLLLIASCGEFCPDTSKHTGPYLGEEPPGLTPIMFGQYLAAPEHHKHSAPAFSPDGQEMFFSVYFNYEYPQNILYTKQVNGVWADPEVAFFSGVYQEGGPVFSPDGKRVYFYSKRPQEPDTVQLEEANIWYIEKIDSVWSNPKFLEGPVNDYEGSSSVQSFTPDGNAIIGHSKGLPNYDFLLSQTTNDNWSEPISFGPPVCDPDIVEGNALMTPDGQNLIFFRYDPNNRSLAGLYMCEKSGNGSWSEPKRMGDMFCNGESRFSMLSPDNKYMFFTSYRSGPEEIYWVDASIVDTLKKYDLNLSILLTEKIVQNGVVSGLTEYDKYKTKYSNFYLFDGKLLDNVANQLLAKNLNTEAITIINKSMELHPKTDTVFHNIRLAVLTENKSELHVLADIIKSEDTSVSNRCEININQLGYELLVWQQPELAVIAFQLNVDIFPASSNVFDSYAEGLLIVGDTTNSIINYKKSLELNPENQNAINVLKSLGVE